MIKTPTRTPVEAFLLCPDTIQQGEEDNRENRQANRAQILDEERENRPYYHMGDDPDPPQTRVNKETFREMVRAMRD